MAIVRPGIPAVDQGIDNAIKRVLMPLKENAEIANGIRSGPDAWKRRSVTLEMLVQVGVITEDQAKQLASMP